MLMSHQSVKEQRGVVLPAACLDAVIDITLFHR